MNPSQTEFCNNASSLEEQVRNAFAEGHTAETARQAWPISAGRDMAFSSFAGTEDFY
ncbi:hypothetical protein [Salipiger sp. HF18]|uniref:hypothetical protein n=1 Tax=Salipiger sp. HF18 TaxID=2721557 RepID=UPI00142E5B17|nr:hypothetical protein [Salipiger sp. HF18]